jgi:hypothetical protein
LRCLGSHWIFVRPDEVITPPGMPRQHDTTYVLDTTVTRHGIDVAGTAAEWAAELAAPLRGNSNIALSLGTFLAAPYAGTATENRLSSAAGPPCRWELTSLRVPSAEDRSPVPPPRFRHNRA